MFSMDFTILFLPWPKSSMVFAGFSGWTHQVGRTSPGIGSFEPGFFCLPNVLGTWGLGSS
jgi:hypothetical protein